GACGHADLKPSCAHPWRQNPVLLARQLLVEGAELIEKPLLDETSRFDSVIAEVAGPLQRLARRPESLAFRNLRNDDGPQALFRLVEALGDRRRREHHVAVDEEEPGARGLARSQVALGAALGTGLHVRRRVSLSDGGRRVGREIVDDDQLHLRGLGADAPQTCLQRGRRVSGGDDDRCSGGHASWLRIAAFSTLADRSYEKLRLHSRAPAPSFARSAGSSARRRIARARSSGVAGTTRPVCSCRTESRSPGTSYTIAGVPQAAASVTTSPQPSRTEVTSSASASAIRRCFLAASSRPQNSTSGVRPSAAACRRKRPT